MNELFLAFLTGLTTGGLSCLAVQGGLLASSMTSSFHEDSGTGQSISLESHWKHIALFLFTKLFAYTVLGFFLGFIGSTLVLSPKLLGVMQIAAGVVMIATALRIANVHPIFRYLVIEPPRWAYRTMRRVSRDGSGFAPALLGFLTVFMPCGITQATMAVAVASGNPWTGAAIMFAFILGTSPIFFLLGATILSLLKRRVFAYVASAIVALFAVLSINGGLGLYGSFYTIQNVWRAATMNVDELALNRGVVAGATTNGVQRATISVASNGYTSDITTIKVNQPVKLRLVSENVRGCARAFTIPDLGISKVLPTSGTEEIEFTPTKTGRLAYACSMGMYTGSFTVIP